MTFLNLENLMLILYGPIYAKYPEQENKLRQSALVLPQAGRGWKGGIRRKIPKEDENILKLTVAKDAELCECTRNH